MLETAHIPAPTGGINAVDPASGIPPSDCVYAWNVIPDEFGLRARTGYREWVTGITGAADNRVSSVLTFRGSAASGTADKLFACTSSGIWDVSASTAAPAVSIAFAQPQSGAGFVQAAGMVTTAGHFLAACDEVNGYHVYTESTAAWAKVAQGGGAAQVDNVDPATFVFPVVHKRRLWFVKRDTAEGWYLAAGAVYGAATKFDFGQQFPHGGHLVGLWSWTYDGGAGPDDLLVAVSSSGDVAIYQGTNPADASAWGIKGVWYVGGVPSGRRIATDRGGELMLATVLGMLPLSRLVIAGATGETPDQAAFVSRKIAPLFAGLVNTYGDAAGWSVLVHPADNALLVTVPTSGGQAATTQLALSLVTGGWFQYRALPIVSGAVWGNELYFGTADGRVCRAVGWVDDLKLGSSTDWDAIAWSVLTAYQNLGSARQKQIQSMRPILMSGTPNASIQATARYNYQTSEPAAPIGNGGGGAGAWGTALWGSAVWGTDYSTTQPVQGATGIGREVAIALRGNAISRTTLVGVDVLFSQGGPL